MAKILNFPRQVAAAKVPYRKRYAEVALALRGAYARGYAVGLEQSTILWVSVSSLLFSAGVLIGILVAS